MKTPFCWRCGSNIESELSQDKLSFRAVCPKCLAALHSCFGCTHYKRGAPNDCEVPDIELVINKEASNFCEEFSPLYELRGAKTSSVTDIEKKLFGDVDLPKKRDLNDLFKD